MTSVPELLEAKRLELGETKAAFGRRLFPDLKPDSAEVGYGHIIAGRRPYPEKYLKTAAEVLAMEVERISCLPLHIKQAVDLATFDSDTRQYLEAVTEALGFPMSADLITRILAQREIASAINGGST